MRSSSVKAFVLGLVLLCASFIVISCSGTGGSTNGGGFGTVNGFVQDVNGNSVRGATVHIGGISAVTNTLGAYSLLNVPAGNRIIQASVTQDGTLYTGENTVQIFDNNQSRSVTVTVVRDNQRATLKGTVYDRNGFVVQGAKVFAASSELTSTFAITDSQGRFHIDTLYGGFPYAVVASAQGYNSDTDNVTVSPNTTLTQDYTLANVTDTSMAAITDLSATAWTTPGTGLFRPNQRIPDYEALKNMIMPRRASLAAGNHTAHITSGGNYVEIDLLWTPVVNTTNLLGYGIYRGQGDTTVFSDADFWRDPLAVIYADLDLNFAENQTWSYVVTSLNNSFPDGQNSESSDSNRVVAHTLGDLDLNMPLQGPLTFRWFLVTGATSYDVYLYDEFPAYNIDPIWQANSVTNAQIYNGGALQSGHTYYYFVSANGFSGASHSLSVMDSFVAP